MPRSRNVEPSGAAASAVNGKAGASRKVRPSAGRGKAPETDARTRALLAWYDRNARDLPWRRAPAGTGAIDPYAVWLSEVMLQQTTVEAVKPYFARFLARWPDVESLASAPLDDVLAIWAGLGYYARARKLHACAREVADRHGGHFPSDVAALLDLPGIGPYTSAAVAAIAFGVPVAVVDGNVERVIARLFAIETELPAAKEIIRARTQELVPGDRPGDFAQALMDLGAGPCSPRRPACASCPLGGACEGAKRGIAESLPRKAPKKDRPVRFASAFLLQTEQGAVFVRRRPEKGLLGGMLEVPTSPWEARPKPREEALKHAPATAVWQVLPGRVAHTFTHFHLEVDVFLAAAETCEPAGGFWLLPGEMAAAALPSLMRKIIAHGAAPMVRRRSSRHGSSA